MRKACAHKWTGTTRPSLNVTVIVTSKVQGRLGGPQVSDKLNAFSLQCPVQWSANAA